jgi:hypothetical protein
MTIDERIEALTVNVETLHSNIHELWESVQKDRERVDATERAIQEIRTMNLRLANIVIRHDERLDALDGGDE